MKNRASAPSPSKRIVARAEADAAAAAAASIVDEADDNVADYLAALSPGSPDKRDRRIGNPAQQDLLGSHFLNPGSGVWVAPETPLSGQLFETTGDGSNITNDFGIFSSNALALSPMQLSNSLYQLNSPPVVAHNKTFPTSRDWSPLGNEDFGLSEEFTFSDVTSPAGHHGHQELSRTGAGDAANAWKSAAIGAGANIIESNSKVVSKGATKAKAGSGTKRGNSIAKSSETKASEDEELSTIAKGEKRQVGDISSKSASKVRVKSKSPSTVGTIGGVGDSAGDGSRDLDSTGQYHSSGPPNVYEAHSQNKRSKSSYSTCDTPGSASKSVAFQQATGDSQVSYTSLSSSNADHSFGVANADLQRYQQIQQSRLSQHASFLASNSSNSNSSSANGILGGTPEGDAGAVISISAMQSISCNCKKSKCLKLYCDCFRLKKYCDGCNCKECANTALTELERSAAIGQILDRNPDAFLPRVVPDIVSQSKSHLSGCHCKKSACLKKYCECFSGSVPCGIRCRCIDCKNNAEYYGGVGDSINSTPDYSQTGKMISYLQSIQQQGAALSAGLTARQQLSLSIIAAQAQQQQQLQAANMLTAAIVPNNLLSSIDNVSGGKSADRSISLLDTVRLGSSSAHAARPSSATTAAAAAADPLLSKPSYIRESPSNVKTSQSSSNGAINAGESGRASGRHGTVSERNADSPKKFAHSPGRALFAASHNLFGNDASASSLQAIKSELAASLTPPPGGQYIIAGAGNDLHSTFQAPQITTQSLKSPSILSRSRNGSSPLRSASSNSSAGSVGKTPASPSILRSPGSGIRNSAASRASGYSRPTDPQTRSTMRRISNLELEGVSTPPRSHSPQRNPSQNDVVTALDLTVSPERTSRLLDLAGIIEDRGSAPTSGIHSPVTQKI